MRISLSINPKFFVSNSASVCVFSYYYYIVLLLNNPTSVQRKFRVSFGEIIGCEWTGYGGVGVGPQRRTGHWRTPNLRLGQQQTAAEQISSEKEKETEKWGREMPSLVIKNICLKWSQVQSFVENYHPNKAVASRIVNIFNYNALSHFRQFFL